MKIAVLAWGSLVWDKRALRIVGDWQPGGPVLSIEFSRISSDGRLTLVIDPVNGVPVTTLFARSEFENLDDAIANLREREKTSAENIGYLNLVADSERASACRQNPVACRAIKVWAQANGWPAVIWTALTSNYAVKMEKPFVATAAVAYVKKLPKEAREKAIEYIEQAPREVDTPVRQLFNKIQKRHAGKKRPATAADLLGHPMHIEPLPDAPKIIVPNSWHGRRKARGDSYQVPGQTAADMGLGLSAPRYE